MVVHHELSHKPMCLFDAKLREIACVAKIGVIRSAGGTVLVRARSANGCDDQVAALYA
jgi:hypothetical protein